MERAEQRLKLSSSIRRRVVQIISLILLAAVIITIAYAWGSTGHRMINRTAVRHLPQAMNSFKVDSLFYQTHSTDADARRDYSDTSMYAEWPRHFLDMDDYPDFKNLPRDLQTLINLYGWERVKQNGINPWATAWLTDTLAAQLQRNDLNAARQTMSDLGHYVGDAHQPLHATANYNGQLSGNYGIHSRYESSMLNIYQNEVVVVPESVQYVSSVLDFAFEYLYQSNSYVDSVMDADDYAKTASGWNGSGTPPSTYYAALWEKTKSYTKLQIQRGSVDLASIWYTAWVNAGLSPVVEDALAGMPDGFELKQNYPNPFNPTTNFQFSIDNLQLVTLKILDLSGKEVEILINKELPRGTYTAEWNAVNNSSGIYFYKLQVGNRSQIKKMVLMK